MDESNTYNTYTYIYFTFFLSFFINILLEPVLKQGMTIQKNGYKNDFSGHAEYFVFFTPSLIGKRNPRKKMSMYVHK